MKTNGNDKALESYKIFPYVAWAVTIGFTLFVYNLVVQLSETINQLQESTQYLTETIRANPNGLNFENRAETPEIPVGE